MRRNLGSTCEVSSCLGEEERRGGGRGGYRAAGSSRPTDGAEGRCEQDAVCRQEAAYIVASAMIRARPSNQGMRNGNTVLQRLGRPDGQGHRATRRHARYDSHASMHLVHQCTWYVVYAQHTTCTETDQPVGLDHSGTAVLPDKSAALGRCACTHTHAHNTHNTHNTPQCPCTSITLTTGAAVPLPPAPRLTW